MECFVARNHHRHERLQAEGKANHYLLRLCAAASNSGNINSSKNNNIYSSTSSSRVSILNNARIIASSSSTSSSCSCRAVGKSRKKKRKKKQYYQTRRLKRRNTNSNNNRKLNRALVWPMACGFSSPRRLHSSSSDTVGCSKWRIHIDGSGSCSSSSSASCRRLPSLPSSSSSSSSPSSNHRLKQMSLISWGVLNSMDIRSNVAKNTNNSNNNKRGPPLPLPALDLLHPAEHHPSPAAASAIKNHPHPLPLPLPNMKQQLRHFLMPSPPQTTTAIDNNNNLAAVFKIGFDELQAACRGFAPDSCVGHGDRGTVYKCRVGSSPENRTEALVTKLHPCDEQQSFRDWMNEVKALASLSHPHLCKMIGYSCSDQQAEAQQQRCLIYERSTCNTSLDKLLYGRKNQHSHLEWGQRIKILLGAARGLAFLHAKAASSSSPTCSSQVMYYRELRPFNVGVDKDSNAKLMGYSIWCRKKQARGGDGGAHMSSKGVYAAPETVFQAQLSARSNVWSFGIIILETLTGRQNLDGNPKDLALLSTRLLEDDKKMLLMLDPQLRTSVLPQDARKVAQIARDCLQLDPRLRPDMNQVVDRIQRVEQEIQASSKPKSLREILHDDYEQQQRQRSLIKQVCSSYKAPLAKKKLRPCSTFAMEGSKPNIMLLHRRASPQV